MAVGTRRDHSRLAFAVTWDYRCPFARNAHEHVVAGLRAGAPWDVTFVPFSLGQVHVAEGEPDIWDRWQDDTGLLALQAGVVVRDQFPDRFLDVHEALFALRHDHGGHLRDEARCAPCSRRRASTPTSCSPRSTAATPLATVQRRARGRRPRPRRVGRADVHRRRPGRLRAPDGPAGGRRRARRRRRSSGSSTCSPAGPSSTSSSTPRSPADRGRCATWPRSVARWPANARCAATGGCPTSRR